MSGLPAQNPPQTWASPAAHTPAPQADPGGGGQPAWPPRTAPWSAIDGGILPTLAAVFLLTALASFIGRGLDQRALLDAVAGHTTAAPGSGRFVQELNSWVYHHGGFAKNNRYFIVPSLGPTPHQVLTEGGDCEDKSRLLATLLRLHGMESTLVTLRDCEGCKPLHVVVEAATGQGWMAADPSYDLVFPRRGAGYHGVQELKAKPDLLIERIIEIIKTQGQKLKAARYKVRLENYTYAEYINWERSPGTRWVAGRLAEHGVDIATLRRPWFFEDPQFLVGSFSTLAGGILLLIHLGLRRKRRGAASIPTPCHHSEQSTHA